MPLLCCSSSWIAFSLISCLWLQILHSILTLFVIHCFSIQFTSPSIDAWIFYFISNLFVFLLLTTRRSAISHGTMPGAWTHSWKIYQEQCRGSPRQNDFRKGETPFSPFFLYYIRVAFSLFSFLARAQDQTFSQKRKIENPNIFISSHS